MNVFKSVKRNTFEQLNFFAWIFLEKTLTTARYECEIAKQCTAVRMKKVAIYIFYKK